MSHRLSLWRRSPEKVCFVDIVCRFGGLPPAWGICQRSRWSAKEKLVVWLGDPGLTWPVIYAICLLAFVDDERRRKGHDCCTSAVCNMFNKLATTIELTFELCKRTISEDRMLQWLKKYPPIHLLRAAGATIRKPHFGKVAKLQTEFMRLQPELIPK